MASIQKRQNANGKTSYRVQVRLKGHPVERATFDRLTDARSWAQATEVAIKERRYFKSAEAKKHTLSELIERYLQRVEKDNPKRISDIKPMLEWWDTELGYIMLSDISRAIIVEKRDKLTQRTVGRKNPRTKELEQVPISPARINRYISALGHALTIAMNEWEWIEDNPVRKISKLKEPRGRVRFLDDEERAALLEACANSFYENLYLIVVLALSTGARKSEILNLRWDDIDLGRGQIVLHETKNGERRAIPLTGHALSLVKEHKKVQRIDTDLLFPSIKGNKPYEIKKSWEASLREASIEDFRFHDLRHSAASYLAMNGASLAEVADVLGHKTLQMVKRYAHLSESHTSNVVARMNERIFK